MMTHAYSHTYLNKAARTVGNMLHDAVIEFSFDGTEFLDHFIQSEIAEQIENGNPKYISGKSGQELFLDVIALIYGNQTVEKYMRNIPIRTYERSEVYWIGWMLTHYQWYSGRSFRNILEVLPYNELLGLYSTLHEADIQKSYEVLDTHFYHSESKLKQVRKNCNLTQEELSNLSGVSLNTIRAYERKAKDIDKAQIDIVLRLVNALKCDIKDLLN